MKKILIAMLLLFMGTTSAEAQMSWWSVAFPPSREAQEPIRKSAAQLAAMVPLDESASFHEKVDAVRQFIQLNSVHKIDDEFYSYWGKMPLLMQLILFNASGSINDKPHMECSTRAAVMYHILRAMNIRARPVVAYNGDDITDSHAFLEVYNPEIDEWEIQDPDKNVFWKFKDNGTRAATEDLISKPLEKTFLPCRSEQDCGYPETSKESLTRFFALASIIDFDAGNNPLLANPARLDMDHPFLEKENPMAYCTLFEKGACHSEIIEIEAKNSQ